jgi:hypothetical protein
MTSKLATCNEDLQSSQDDSELQEPTLITFEGLAALAPGQSNLRNRRGSRVGRSIRLDSRTRVDSSGNFLLPNDGGSEKRSAYQSEKKSIKSNKKSVRFSPKSSGSEEESYSEDSHESRDLSSNSRERDANLDYKRNSLQPKPKLKLEPLATKGPRRAATRHIRLEETQLLGPDSEYTEKQTASGQLKTGVKISEEVFKNKNFLSPPSSIGISSEFKRAKKQKKNQLDHQMDTFNQLMNHGSHLKEQFDKID